MWRGSAGALRDAARNVEEYSRKKTLSTIKTPGKCTNFFKLVVRYIRIVCEADVEFGASRDRSNFGANEHVGWWAGPRTCAGLPACRSRMGWLLVHASTPASARRLQVFVSDERGSHHECSTELQHASGQQGQSAGMCAAAGVYARNAQHAPSTCMRGTMRGASWCT